MPVAATVRDDAHPLFSPSDRWLYFSPDHKNVYRVPGPGQGWARAEPQPVTSFPDDSETHIEDPQLSADGTRLVYSRGSLAGDLWILELE
jgi:hypothetical protein